LKIVVLIGSFTAFAFLPMNVCAAEAPQHLPTGQSLTPLAAPGARFEPLVTHTGPLPDYIADGAALIAVRVTKCWCLPAASTGSTM
jgi:hypothetical protein